MDNPDIYFEGAHFLPGAFDLALLLSIRPAEPPTPGVPQTPKTVGCVRTSLPHAKLLTILLQRMLKQIEERQGYPIRIPPEILRQHGISEQEDW
jgi:hypothetical protein